MITFQLNTGVEPTPETSCIPQIMGNAQHNIRRVTGLFIRATNVTFFEATQPSAI
jgi:hypothetical protein